MRAPIRRTSADADVAARRSLLQPVHFARLFRRPLETSRIGRRPHRLGPRAICWREIDGEVVGVVPCYLKSHSQGEYVFDHGWAEAYERAGGNYYPEAPGQVPFTPATGPRLLVRTASTQRGPRATRRRPGRPLRGGASLVGPLHLPAGGRMGVSCRTRLPARTDQQFHWGNEGYATFEDFLGTLPRDSARPSGANGAMRWPTASPSIG